MDPCQQIIAEALMSGDRVTGLRRITCNAAVVQQINCNCGNVLDQETVVVVETADERTVAAYCPTCWTRAKRLWEGHTAVTWDSAEKVQ